MDAVRKAFVASLVAVGIGLVGWILYALGAHFESCVLVSREIKSVGGCDKAGFCGVSFEDGTHGMKLYPSVGQTIISCE